MSSPLFQNTAWSVQAARGVFLAIVCALLGSVYADFYQQPWMSEAVNRYFYNKVSPTAPRYTASLQAPRYYQGAYMYL